MPFQSIKISKFSWGVCPRPPRFSCFTAVLSLAIIVAIVNSDGLTTILVDSALVDIHSGLNVPKGKNRYVCTYVYNYRSKSVYQNSLVTVKIPELVTIPIIFEELHAYVPTSDDVTLYTVSVFSVVVMFNDLDTIIYLLLSFIITPLKYQLMSGTGSPTAWHKNVTFSLWFLTSLAIKISIPGITIKIEDNLQLSFVLFGNYTITKSKS